MQLWLSQSCCGFSTFLDCLIHLVTFELVRNQSALARNRSLRAIRIEFRRMANAKFQYSANAQIIRTLKFVSRGCDDVRDSRDTVRRIGPSGFVGGDRAARAARLCPTGLPGRRLYMDAGLLELQR